MSRGESATPLGKVRGLGSAHHGGGHWLEERFTSVALVLLSFWLVFSLLMLPNFELATLKEWLGSAWGAIPMALGTGIFLLWPAKRFADVRVSGGGCDVVYGTLLPGGL